MLLSTAMGPSGVKPMSMLFELSWADQDYSTLIWANSAEEVAGTLSPEEPVLKSYDHDSRVWVFEKGRAAADKIVRLLHIPQPAPLDFFAAPVAVERKVKLVDLDGTVLDAALLARPYSITLTARGYRAYCTFPYRLTEDELRTQVNRLPDEYHVRFLDWDGWEVVQRVGLTRSPEE